MTCITPSMATFSKSINFTMRIDRFTNLDYYIISTNLPGVSMSAIDNITPKRVVPQVGDMLQYSPLQCTFILDENLNNYENVYNWIRACSGRDYQEYIDLKNGDFGIYSTINLFVLNNKKNLSRTINFYNCLPVNISDILFNVQDNGETFNVCTVVFNYEYFELKGT